MTLDDAIKREKLYDELNAMQWINVAQLPDESYEDTLKRRAQIRLRQDEIRSELASLS